MRSAKCTSVGVVSAGCVMAILLSVPGGPAVLAHARVVGRAKRRVVHRRSRRWLGALPAEVVVEVVLAALETRVPLLGVADVLDLIERRGRAGRECERREQESADPGTRHGRSPPVAAASPALAGSGGRG